MTGRRYARALDAVDGQDGERTATGWQLRVRKTVRESDPYMAGHFPGLVLLPAVFLLETVRQAVATATEDTTGGWLEISAIRQMRLLRPMPDGCELTIDLAVTEVGGGFACVARVEDAGVRVAELSLDLEVGVDGP